MTAATTLRRLLMASVFTLGAVACSDTDIQSPGAVTVTPTPTPTATPTPTPTPTATTVSFVPTAGCASIDAGTDLDEDDNVITVELVATTVDLGNDTFAEVCSFPGLNNGGVLPVAAKIPADTTVFIQGVTTVGSDSGANSDSATLTIEPGATIVGNEGSDVLVVTRGSQILAEGTAANPIIFTSLADVVAGDRTGTDTARGEWGGIVINGRAPINDCDSGFTADVVADAGTATCVKSGEGNSGFFGGAIPDDTSGTLRYAQVRYAGSRFTTQNELNGIAFQGVGNGRPAGLAADKEPFEFIQVHNNADDGVEFFGGTVNARYLVLTGNGDDSLDWTDGWVGNAQYVLIQHGNGAGDNGFESDNRGNDEDVLPRSNPTISNVTFVGDEALTGGRALRLREGTGGLIANSIFVKTGDDCMRVDDEQNDASVVGVDLLATNTLNLESVLFDCATDFSDDSDSDVPNVNEAEVVFNAVSPFFVDTDDPALYNDDDELVAEGPAINTNVSADNSLAQSYFPGPVELAVPALDLTITGNGFANVDGDGLPGRTGVSADFIAARAFDGSAGQAGKGFVASFFDSVDYIGAFGPDDVPGNTIGDNWAAGWSFGLFEAAAPVASCPTGTIATADTIADANGVDKPVCRLQGTLTSNITLTNDNVYQLNGVVSVGEDNAPTSAGGSGASASSAVLTVQEGTTIYGVNGPDVLVVARGSQIIANGTAAAPIVFTSDEDLLGQNTAGTERGQFGGLVINGKAPINDCDSAFAAADQGGTVNCVKSGEGNSGFFGGDAADDASGVLRYAQVRYAGFRFNPQNELNGIAFQGVGNGVSAEAAAVLADGETPFEFIQVHNNADDGVEFFGGTANIRNLVLVGNGDDSLDWTDGWVGNAQFVIIEQGNGDGDNGFESDNRGNDEDVLPRSNPTISNVTIVGSPNTGNRGLRLREGTGGLLANFIVRDMFDAGLYVDEEQVDAAIVGADLIATGALRLESAWIDTAEPFDGDGDVAPFSGGDEAVALFDAGSNNNRRPDADLATPVGSLTGFSFLSDGLGLVPTSDGGEAGVTAFDIAAEDAFFTSVDYIGAIAPGTAAGASFAEGWTFVDADSTR